MVKNTDIEQVFFGVLQEGSNKDEIDKKLRYFTDKDWQALLDFSAKKGLFPQFYNRLLSLKLINISPEILSEFQKLYLFNLKSNILYEKELFRVIAHFKELAIPLIPLKGPVLARYLYKDLSLRQLSCDLDLLVFQENLKKAEGILESLDYYANTEEAPGHHKFNNQIPFLKRKARCPVKIVELHWDLRNRFIQTQIQDFWSNARETEIDGHRVFVPSDEDLFLYLVLISIFDGNFIQIRYLYDLHTLITRFGKKIDWQVLIKKAEKFNLITALFFSLRLSKDLFHTDIQNDLLKAIKPPIIKLNLLKIWINKNKILQPREKSRRSYTWDYFISIYLRSSNILDCIKRIYKRIFLSMEEVMWLYDRPLSTTSYCLYIKRLFKPFIVFGKKM